MEQNLAGTHAKVLTPRTRNRRLEFEDSKLRATLGHKIPRHVPPRRRWGPTHKIHNLWILPRHNLPSAGNNTQA